MASKTSDELPGLESACLETDLREMAADDSDRTEAPPEAAVEVVPEPLDAVSQNVAHRLDSLLEHQTQFASDVESSLGGLRVSVESSLGELRASVVSQADDTQILLAEFCRLNNKMNVQTGRLLGLAEDVAKLVSDVAWLRQQMAASGSSSALDAAAGSDVGPRATPGTTPPGAFVSAAPETPPIPCRSTLRSRSPR